jgi:KRAB domain-containing zinc finger protein
MAKHEKIRYPCKKCDYRATVVCDLKKHILTKHEGFRYPCNMCDYLGTTNHNLKKHKQSKHEGVRYPCDSCDHRATDPVNLKRHKLTKHSGERFPCENCDHKSTTPSDLKKHIISKHDGARFSCDLCDYIGTEWNLKKHRGTKHKEQQQILLLACQGCAFETPNMEELRAHMAALHQPNGMLRHSGASSYPCESCSFVAASEESWRRHNFLDHIETTKCASGGGVINDEDSDRVLSDGRLKMETEGQDSEARHYQCQRCSYATPLLEYLGRYNTRYTHGVEFHTLGNYVLLPMRSPC